MKRCTHQFFETIKIQESQDQYLDKPKTDGTTPMLTHTRYGVRVLCAICGEQRNLWQDGKIAIYDESTQQWRALQNPRYTSKT